MRNRLISILLLVLVASPSMARNGLMGRDDAHYFGVYAQGAYAKFHPWHCDLTIKNGYEVGGGLVYELQKNYFLMQTGLGFSWQQGGWKYPNTIRSTSVGLVDDQGYSYTLMTEMTRSDVVRRGAIEVPVLFGARYGWFYFLAGIKMGYTVVDRSLVRANITNVSYYDHLIDPVYDVPKHGYYTARPIEQPDRFMADLDLRLSAEIGATVANILTDHHTRILARMALFADYGVFTQTMGAQSNPNLSPLMTIGTGNLMGNALVGGKFTLLVGVNDGKQACKVCRFSRQ